MFKRARKWLAGRRRARLSPLAARMQDAPGWTNDDAETLALFLESPTGAKLRERLWDGAVNGSMAALGAGEFERGKVAGLVNAVELIEAHTEKSEAPEEE